eukprot:11225743-Lingulodinium_polyedra.AAC.1
MLVALCVSGCTARTISPSSVVNDCQVLWATSVSSSSGGRTAPNVPLRGGLHVFRFRFSVCGSQA